MVGKGRDVKKKKRGRNIRGRGSSEGGKSARGITSRRVSNYVDRRAESLKLRVSLFPRFFSLFSRSRALDPRPRAAAGENERGGRWAEFIATWRGAAVQQ